MQISSHQHTHVHLDQDSPVERVNVIAGCVAFTLENGDQFYLHIGSDAIQKIAAQAADI
tara:strand:+ start:333 stop:509 length:177 start_codon:yes stop_codon:yes gene_type:complete